MIDQYSHSCNCAITHLAEKCQCDNDHHPPTIAPCAYKIPPPDHPVEFQCGLDFMELVLHDRILSIRSIISCLFQEGDKISLLVALGVVIGQRF